MRLVAMHTVRPPLGGGAANTGAWRGSARRWTALGILAGGLGAVISLEGMFLGMALTAAGATWMLRRAGIHRWPAAGGFMLGAGGVVAAVLSPALSNHDPAVTYDASTIPVFAVGCAVGCLGAMLVLVMRHHRRPRTFQSDAQV